MARRSLDDRTAERLLGGRMVPRAALQRLAGPVFQVGSSHSQAPVATPNSGGTDTANAASGGASGHGTSTPAAHSHGASTAGSANSARHPGGH